MRNGDMVPVAALRVETVDAFVQRGEQQRVECGDISCVILRFRFDFCGRGCAGDDGGVKTDPITYPRRLLPPSASIWVGNE